MGRNPKKNSPVEVGIRLSYYNDRLENTSKSWEPPWDFSHQHFQRTNISPFKGTFWRWFSFSQGGISSKGAFERGYVSFLEGKYV